MIRGLQFDDIDRIVELEREESSPWTRNSLVQEIDCIGGLQFTAEDERTETLLGWCCCRWLDQEAELLRITVLGTRRKNGVASALLAHLIRQLVASGVATLFLEVRAHNHPALQFYRKHGFIEIGLRRKYYDDPQDDALIFSKNLLYD